MLEQNPSETTLLTDLIRDQSHHLKERSVDRTVEVLAAKRDKFREEIQQLIGHLSLLVPIAGSLSTHEASQAMLVQEAINRLGDEAFAQFLLQILKEMQ